MGTWRRRMVLAGVTGMTAALAVAVAQAAGSRPLTVSGSQTIVDESKGVYEMHGSLVGTWYVLTYVPHYQSTTQLAATGKEKFVGCLDTNRNASCDSEEAAGTLSLTYTYWARFKNGGKSLVRGACVHPIVGGTKGFAHAKGVIFMKDTPAGKTVRTTYTGTLELGASRRTLSSSASAGRRC